MRTVPTVIAQPQRSTCVAEKHPRVRSRPRGTIEVHTGGLEAQPNLRVVRIPSLGLHFSRGLSDMASYSAFGQLS